MERVEIDGTLPVALKKIVGQTEISSKSVIMRQPTAIEYLDAQVGLKAGQYITIADLAAMTKLVDEDGTEHEISYDMIGHSSKANLDYLQSLREQLDAKPLAVESSSEHSSSEL